MPRYKLTIEYDGTPFHGWQRQIDLASVQGTLETAIFNFTRERVDVYGSGRTDAGVHAYEQVAHVDILRDMTPHAIREAINFYTRNKGVAVKVIEPVSPDFHARFSAVRRSYIYKISVQDTPPILDKNRVWQIYTHLNTQAMEQAASLLIGTHDFTSFRSADCQSKSPVKSIEAINITNNDSQYHFHFIAKSYLHHQVRNMTGALKMVGEGKWSVADFAAAKEAKDRNKGGVLAPAHGLYLNKIEY